VWYAFVPNLISSENRKLLLEFFAVTNIVKLTFDKEIRGNENALVINTAQKPQLNRCVINTVWKRNVIVLE
jgi:hypothetical protein